MKAEDGMEVRPVKVSQFLPGSTNLICQLSPPFLFTLFIIRSSSSRGEKEAERGLDLDQLPLRLLYRSRMLHILLDLPSTQVGKHAKAKKYIL